MYDSKEKNFSKKKSNSTTGFTLGFLGLVAFLFVLCSNSNENTQDIITSSIVDEEFGSDSINNSLDDNAMGFTNCVIDSSDSVNFEESFNGSYNDIVLTTSGLNFRTAPTTDSDIILSFSQNTELKVISWVGDNWILVKYNGVSGYVYADYTLSLLAKAKEQYPWLDLKELDVKKIVYSITDLKVRNGDSVDYSVIGNLVEYESVRVLEQYGQWYFIMTNDYSFGFISKDYTSQLGGNFVVVDISEQQLYLYNNDELCFTTPVTTGKESTPTDIGLFSIYSKEQDRILNGVDYSTSVDYWMPYNGGEGLHDASWHNLFGTDGYKINGSHGCVNLPPSITDDIFNNVQIGSKVLVHK